MWAVLGLVQGAARWVGGCNRPLATCSVGAMSNVEIYTWRACPFCVRAKQLLDRKGVPYRENAIDGDEAAREAMAIRTGQGRRSVPQIFIDDHPVGGCDDLHALERSGQLDQLLSA